MAIMATLQKKCDFWIWRNVSEYEENVISVNFGKVWEWIPMYHQLWKETDFVSHAQPNYTPERDTHFPNYTENLHLTWEINFAMQR